MFAGVGDGATGPIVAAYLAPAKAVRELAVAIAVQGPAAAIAATVQQLSDDEAVRLQGFTLAYIAQRGTRSRHTELMQ